MTVFNPIWRVTIGGVQYQTAILANLTITSGRTNIYEQANAGYINLEIINLDIWFSLPSSSSVLIPCWIKWMQTPFLLK